VVSAQTRMPHTGAMDPERPPVVSLELVFNSSLESQIRAEWQALADAGLSSLAAHTAPSNRPHITLMVRPFVPPLSRTQLAALVNLPLPLTLGAPILFGSGDRRVLARSVVPTAPLVEFHAALHALVDARDGAGGAGSEDSPFTRPGRWMPHVTLSRRLRLDTLPQALRALDQVHPGDDDSPSEAITLRRWDAATATITDLLG
jgi:2'-5' RNA ligase